MSIELWLRLTFGRPLGETMHRRRRAERVYLSKQPPERSPPQSTTEHLLGSSMTTRVSESCEVEVGLQRIGGESSSEERLGSRQGDG
jgi:hypothetical protein